jgi:hypothetical protein
MDRTRIAKNVTKTLATAALGGMLVGSVGFVSGGCAKDQGSQSSGVAGDKHACKGQNACKGQGGCKSEKSACKGQNACKGQGGCKTM